jgi:hypothetical protein
LLGALFLSAPLAATPVKERLQLLADQAGTPLNFEETRNSGLLSEPITVRGRLIYDAATGQLTKQVDTPRPARLSVTETHLVAQVGDGPRRRLPLDRRPDLAGLLVAVRALLAGDVAAVENRFDTTLASDEDTGEWVLALQPRDPNLAEDLRRVEVMGLGDQVHTLQATLGNEVQRMTILPRETEPSAEDDAR